MSFTQVLNLSISASWLVVAIVLARVILKHAPKALHCALWALVAVRLLCPVSFESEMSLIPSREVIPESYLQMEPVEQSTPARLEIVTNPVYEDSLTIDTETTVDRVQNWDLYATLLWLAGMGAMGIYAAYSYLSIRIRIRMAGWSHGRVWECDDIDSPFILGLLRPRIYLPSGLDEITKAHVLAHENAHLKRLDHIWKPLGFALLTVHWFNPVMWAAYVLLCRDIELACDEKVIKRLEKPQVRAYSEALVRCSVSQRRIAMCPLAFGEVGVKGRIKSMLNYKKPGFWVILIAIVVSIAVAVCFLTDPVEKPDTLQHIREEDGCTIVSQNETAITLTLDKSLLPADVLKGREYHYEPGEVVLARTDNTTYYLESARLYGIDVLLTIHPEFEISESGTILLPYRFKNGGREWTAAVESGNATITHYGPDPAFTVVIDRDVYAEDSKFLVIEFSKMNLLTYRANHLVDAPTTKPTELEAIVKEDGFLITSNVEDPIHIMFYTHWLPESFESGYSFAEDELVLFETETTSLQMKYAMLDGEQYCFDFQFSYDLPETGTIYVPYFANIKGIDSSLRLKEGQTHDFTHHFEEGVTLSQVRETEAFSLHVDKEVYENLDDYLSVTLEGVYALTYVPGGIGLPMGYYLDVADFQGTTRMERFIVTENLHLIGCEPTVLFPIERDLGELHPVSLSGTSVAMKLKRENLRAWQCEAYGTAHLLLQQQDGSLYVYRLRADGNGHSDLYELAAEGEPVPVGRKIEKHNFTLEVSGTFDVPMFTLYSDGTFMFHVSMLSSYLGHGSFTLTEERLVLKTGDGIHTWTFDVNENGLAFDAERSTPIEYFKNLKELTEVTDGELFRTSTLNTYEPPALEQSVKEAISAAILEANTVDRHTSIRAASHRILAEMIACGVAAEDGSTPVEALSICILGAYTEKSTDGTMLYIENTHVFPAKLSFREQDGEYELTEYRELSDLEAKEEFPDFAWADLASNRDKYRAELLTVCREQESAQLAVLQEQIAEAEQLFDVVASGPLQYSNPGAYIDAHPVEWERLLELGAATVHYSFRQLAAGEEQGLKGYLMALASQEIIESWGEDCTVDSYYNGQDWFSKFYQHAKSVSNTHTWDSLRRDHPGCTLAIIHTEYLIFHPF